LISQRKASGAFSKAVSEFDGIKYRLLERYVTSQKSQDGN